ncbi:MAG: hypothetical protein NTV77_01255 [Candidatus Azambacteria bacterium]|nr:hypothetical protein [Candidatus Azambacteria bacterium]
MKRWQIDKEKHFWFLVVIILVFLVSTLAVSMVGANGPPKVTKTTKLEAKLAEIEVDSKQIKEELGQIKKDLARLKNSLENMEKKLAKDLKFMDKKLVDQQKIHKSNFLWLVIIALIALAIALSALVVVPLTRWKNLCQR